MTEQQRREIRAELARRMGCVIENIASEPSEPIWAVTQKPDWLKLEPIGFYVGNVWSIPDPSTNAADKDALVAWLAADWVLWKKFFLEFTALIIPAMMQSEDYLGRIGETDNYTIGPSKAEWGWALMTAPREAITLAAAKALGIGEAE